ncbi:MAG: phosphate acyltransferase PlsX [Actinomycetota bacterium]
MARVAVDAMGGDNAPEAIVQGAALAAAEGVEILLAGPRDRLEKCLADTGAALGEGIEIVDAPDVIPMDDPDPARAVRSRRTSSISVASRLVKDGRADAVFSAGSTGAAMAGAVLETGRIRGVARPAIALVLPLGDAPTVLVDAGANVDVRPEHLVGFATLGSVFAEVRLGIGRPRVGLLSVGEEPGKGSELVKAAFPLLEAADVNFIGNVEGRDIPSDRVDVVVTDGFTGNVVLKLLEGFGRFLFGELTRIFTATDEAKDAAKVLMPGLLELATQMSPETHGGAHLLGVKGVCIIGHGSSSADAVLSAIRIAAQTVDGGLVGKVSERLAAAKAPAGADPEETS